MNLYTIRNMLSQGKSIYDWYVDEGISGTSVKKRENFLRMVEDVKKGKFDLILTKEISRFSRNTLDGIKYTQELLICGVGVHFLSDNINTFQLDSELRLTIMSSIAQEEIRKLSERNRFWYKRNVEKGIVPGSNNIYGYIKNRGKLVIDEEQAKFIKLIFETYVSENIGVHRLGFKLFDEYGVEYLPYSERFHYQSITKELVDNTKDDNVSYVIMNYDKQYFDSNYEIIDYGNYSAVIKK